MSVHAIMMAMAVLLLEPGDAAKRDLSQLQGHWTTTSLVLKGQEATPEVVEALKTAFEGETYTEMRGVEVIEEGKIKIDPAKKPKAIDFIIKAGETRLGIYEIDGDTLRICVTPPGVGERPTEFKSTAEGETDFVVLKRAKP